MTIAVSNNLEPTKAGSAHFGQLRARYEDAYGVARGLVTTGNFVKIAGRVIGGLLLLVGIIVVLYGLIIIRFFQARMPMLIGGTATIALGVIAAGACFIFGTLIAAAGQFMSAGIDTAVNTAENVSADEKAEILGLC